MSTPEARLVERLREVVRGHRRQQQMERRPGAGEQAVSTKQHGELVRPGDEFNREPWYYCGQCGLVDGRQLPECDGLRKPFRRAADMTDPQTPSAEPKMPEPDGWVTMWPAMGGGRKPVYSPGKERPSYGAELDALLNVYPVCKADAAEAYAEALAAERDALREALTDEHKAVYNQWRVSLENCISGDNYLSANEYRELIGDLDVLYRLLAALQQPKEPSNV